MIYLLLLKQNELTAKLIKTAYNMKKSIITLALLLSTLFMMAQTEFDALKYVQTDINGTARYMGMAGAFGALGGDASAIKDNPAGLGIYRRSELTGTVNSLFQNSSSSWNGANGLSDLYKVGFNNFTYVIAAPTWRSENGNEGLLSSNFSFGYNRLKNFNRSLNIKSGESASSMTHFLAGFTGNTSSGDLTYSNSYEPFDNTNVSWLSELAFEGKLMNENNNSTGRTWSSLLGNNEKVTPSYKLYEKGYLNEYSIGWAGNFSNKLFLGATINYQALNYSATSSYTESFGGGGSMGLNDSIYTRGNGFNLKLGAIVCPVDFLRLGLSVQTPMIYVMTDNYYSTLNFDSSVKGSISTPGGYSNYQIQSPLLLNASAAYIIGNKGLISVEYDYVNSIGTRLRSEAGNADSFDKENDGMRANINDAQTIKIGGEYKVTDNFSLRAGYAYTSNLTIPDAVKSMRTNTLRTDAEFFQHNSTNYITAGFGYRESNWFFDVAFVNKMMNEMFYPYNSNALAPAYAVSPAKVITSNNNVVATLGFKF